MNAAKCNTECYKYRTRLKPQQNAAAEINQQKIRENMVKLRESENVRANTTGVGWRGRHAPCDAARRLSGRGAMHGNTHSNTHVNTRSATYRHVCRRRPASEWPHRARSTSDRPATARSAVCRLSTTATVCHSCRFRGRWRWDGQYFCPYRKRLYNSCSYFRGNIYFDYKIEIQVTIDSNRSNYDLFFLFFVI